MDETVYLDCAATTKVDPRVAEVALRVMTDEYGNAGSRTHLYGSRAKELVETARTQVASAIGCQANEIIFTSGATESNNLAILGAFQQGPTKNLRHVITTAIEHKAVLEPIEQLERQGFEVTRLAPDATGRVREEAVINALRDDTALISVMHVNNETGVIQPIDEIARLIESHPTLFHVDSAQGFTKDSRINHLGRVDLISLSGHKVSAPKGIGALIVRSRQQVLPIGPLMHGGGQERGLRPGTLPVHLIAAFGVASELGRAESTMRQEANSKFRERVVEALEPLNPLFLGDQDHCVPNIVSLAIKGIDSEAFILSTKDQIAISNGSACTSNRYEPSHVLTAMGIAEESRQGAVRISWSHESIEPDWPEVVERLRRLS